MNDHLKKALEENLTELFGKDTKVLDSHSVGGGCINQTAVLVTNQESFFVKWNYADIYPKMFEVEAKGLKLLKDAKEIHIPEAIFSGIVDNTSFLVLENITQASQANNFWEDFGYSLAKLHQHSTEKFGLDHDNYIGSLKQSNDFKDDWATFFTEQRLMKQVQLAIEHGKISGSTVDKFKNLYQRIPEIFPEEQPALLHGDLWSGNYMTNSEGKASIIDPAVYYGNREAEIAFTKLFGGFDPRFYSAYNECFPLENGYQERTDILNLYPLMVHVNLFGGGYVGSVENILRPF